MSYCVNCGVELSKDLSMCPLCNTPVLNPREIPIPGLKGAFPKEKGQVEEVKRKDMAILVSAILATTALTCLLLNLLVFSGSLWSLIVIGVCIVLWVFSIPLVIYKKLPVYVYLLLDGISTAALLFLITYLTGSRLWFYKLGLPIVILCTVLAEMFALCMKKIRITFLTTALYSVVSLAVLCVGVEILIDIYMDQKVLLSWSAVVLTVCSIITIMLVTLLSRSRLRNAVRRRLHF